MRVKQYMCNKCVEKKSVCCAAATVQAGGGGGGGDGGGSVRWLWIHAIKPTLGTQNSTHDSLINRKEKQQ